MQNLIHWLLTPPGEPESSPNAFSARTIAAIMLAAFVPVVVILVYNLLTGDVPIIPGVSALLILMTYSVARLGYAQLARGSFGIMLSVLPILLVVITPPIHIGVIVAMSTASMVMAAVLLTPRIVLWIVALQTIMVAVASVHLPTMIGTDDALNLVMSVFLIGIASLTLAVFHQRQDGRTDASPFDSQSDLMNVLVDRLPAAIVTGQSGQIIYVNQTAARLLGYQTPQDLLNTNLKAHVEGEVDSITSKFSVKEDETLKVEFAQTFKRANGDPVLLKVLAKPAITPRGISNIYTLTPIRDRTLSEKEAVELISQMVDGYMYIVPRTFDDQDIFTRLNDAKSLFKGLSGQSIRTVKDFRGLIVDEDRELYDIHRRILRDGKSHTAEFRLSIDGEVKWVREIGHPMRHGEYSQIYSIGSDITELMLTKHAQGSHIVQQAVVAEIGLLALSENHSAVIEHAMVFVEQVLGVERCELLEYLPLTHSVRKINETGSDGSKLDQSVQHQIKSTYIEESILSGDPIIIEDLRTIDKARLPQYIHDQGYVSSSAIVIHGTPTPFGAMMTYSYQPRHFTEDDLYFMQSVANVVGAVMEQQRMQESEREEREFTEAVRDTTALLNQAFVLPDVFARIIEFIRKIVPQVDAITIYLRDEDDENQLYCAASYNYGDNVKAIRFEVNEVGKFMDLMLARKPVLIDDVRTYDDWEFYPETEWIRGYLGAPIFIDNRFIGLVNLDSAAPGVFTQKDANRVMTFAEKIGTAILNARRTNELERRVRERTEELMAERAQLQAILDGTGEGILYMEQEQIKFANDSFVTMTGYTPQELMQMMPTALLRPMADANHEREIRRNMQTMDIFRSELEIQRKDGTAFSAGVTLSKLDADGRRVVAIVRDISRDKDLEQQKARFIANAAHELRSPITSFNTRLYMLRRKPEEFEEHLGRLEVINRRMNRLVSDLLDMASFEQGHISLRLETLIIQDLLQEIISLQGEEAHEKQIALDLQAPQTPIALLGDGHRLEQVFTNLINNAIHYTGDGGTIHVTVTVDAELVKVQIIDNGQGIPDTELENIFQPFYRADHQQKGTGLGLSIAQEIIAHHGGEISVKSEVNQGSTFCVTLKRLVTDDTETAL